VFYPQVPNATVVFHIQIAHGGQRHFNALKNPHPEVPFSHIGDDTITALTTLAEIFKNKFQKVQIPRLPTAPAKAAERTFPAKSSNPILASPIPPRR
jgi:hypothetical protein